MLLQQAGVPLAVQDSTLRSAIDSMGIGVAILDPQCQFLAFNDSYGHLVGRSEAQVVALSINVHDEHMANQMLRENGDPLGFARAVAGSLQPACHSSEVLRSLVFLLENPSDEVSQHDVMEHLATTTQHLTKTVRDTFVLARSRFLGY